MEYLTICQIPTWCAINFLTGSASANGLFTPCGSGKRQSWSNGLQFQIIIQFSNFDLRFKAIVCFHQRTSALFPVFEHVLESEWVHQFHNVPQQSLLSSTEHLGIYLNFCLFKILCVKLPVGLVAGEQWQDGVIAISNPQNKCNVGQSQPLFSAIEQSVGTRVVVHCKAEVPCCTGVVVKHVKHIGNGWAKLHMASNESV